MQMTPMIDIVFQLLVFFLLTFKIVSLEGDFHVQMPDGRPAPVQTSDLPLPVSVRLIADDRGELSQIKLNARSLGTDFQALREQVAGLLADGSDRGTLPEQLEVELDCDYGLRYEHAIQAITAVSGFLDAEGNLVPLADRVRFAHRRETL
jgi:biopolymer transport protein ExbD